MLCTTMLFCSSIDEEIEVIQKAPVQERYRLMNVLKKKIARMKEQKRLQSIKKIQLITKGKMIMLEQNYTAYEQNVTNIPNQKIEFQNQDILNNQIEIEEHEYEHEEH